MVEIAISLEGNLTHGNETPEKMARRLWDSLSGREVVINNIDTAILYAQMDPEVYDALRAEVLAQCLANPERSVDAGLVAVLLDPKPTKVRKGQAITTAMRDHLYRAIGNTLRCHFPDMPWRYDGKKGKKSISQVLATLPGSPSQQTIETELWRDRVGKI